MKREGLFTLVIVILWLMQGTGFSKGDDPLGDESSPLNVTLSMSNIPLVNETATVACRVSSTMDVPDVTANIILPPNAKLVEGDLTWKGDVGAENPAEFNASIQFSNTGAYLIEALAWKVIDPEKEVYLEGRDAIYLTIKGEQALASSESKEPLKETEIVKRLEWRGTENPGTYEDYIGTQKFSLAPGNVTPVTDATPNVRKPPNFIILVRSEALKNSLSTELNRYVADVERQGYDAQVWWYLDGSSPSPANLKSFLQSRTGLYGVLLVGDLPTAWFEKFTFGESWEQWPIDLYYMDLDGTWTDADSDGLFDSHTGDRAPEIVVARLKADNLNLQGATEINLLKNYFNKDHLYRAGLLPQPKRGLSYIDDDWVPSATEWNNAHGRVYDTTTLVTDKATTAPTDYKNKLALGYDSVLIACHGWSGGQQFKVNDAWDGSLISQDIKTLDPKAIFYNLFICSSTRFTDANYYGGWHIFTSTNGLVAIGSTKTGSMLYFDNYYLPLAQGETVGSAFIEWFKESGVTDIDWFYGMNILGDPLLTPLKYGTPMSIALRANNGQYMCAENGGGNGVVANRNAVGAWETFRLIDLGNGNVALRAANGQYLCAENGGGGAVEAKSNGIGAWETFGKIDI
ncbi:Peptidase family C25 [uncultured archaeon]|nr:Peptidase family C25 [uncultured archaeon]